MKKYTVKIVETLQMEVEVEAESAADAESQIESEWKNEKHVLDSSHFKQVNFVTRSAERNRGYERG